MENNTGKNMKNQEILKNEISFLEKYNLKKEKIEVFFNFVKKYKSEAMNMRISECASLIGFLKSSEIDDKGKEKRRLGGGNFCNSRFCPFCDLRKARKDGYMLLFLLNYLQKVEKKGLIFLTLTAPNVTGDKLDEEIKDFNKAFKRLTETKAFRTICKGYIRKLEVTYQGDQFVNKFNKKKFKGLKIGDKLKSYNTYHPHFHIAIAVNESCFQKKYYISQKKWLEMWQHAKRDKTITQVDTRRCHMNDYKAVQELATYASKSADYLYSESVFDVFYNSLKNKQLIVFNGLFKEILKKYKEGELKEYEELDETVYEQMEWYKYIKKQGYSLFRTDDISETDLEKIYKSEIEID